MRRQHGVVARGQLLELGMSAKAIEHRIERGRLHPLMRGVYAVGRPEVGLRGRWMAAALACGPEALLSHRHAAALWRIRRLQAQELPPGVSPVRAGARNPMGRAEATIDVVVPLGRSSRVRGVRAHRRRDHAAPGGRVVVGIPVTGPVATLVDLATCLPIGQLEAAVNEADHLDLVDPERLFDAIAGLRRRRGARRLRELLAGPTVTLTATKLEQLFLPLARAAGLPAPQTQRRLGRHRVDFFWPELGLVVEADSLRYHRSAFKQAADKRRDHAVSGLATLRFTHLQVSREPGYVRTTLARTLRGLRERKRDR